MAIKYPLANGVWSSSATWNGGTLPDIGDDVYADGKTVTIDQNITVASIRNNTRSGGTVGGVFLCSIPTIVITANVVSSGFNCLNLTHSSGTITVIGNIISLGSAVTLINSGANIILVGDCTGGLGGYAGLSNSGNNTITILGNQIGSSGAGGGCGFSNTGNSLITITGSQYGNANSGIINNNANSELRITGNQYGSSTTVSAAGLINNDGFFTIVGDQLAAIGRGIQNNSLNGVNTINGNAYSSSVANAIGFNCATNNLSSLNFTGSLFNNSSYMAAVVTRLYYNIGSSSVWKFNTVSSGDKNLYGAGINIGMPLISNVRGGVLYGPVNELTGTLKVPNPNTVLLGVQVDNSLGTLLMTPESFLEVLKHDELGARLAVCATEGNITDVMDLISQESQIKMENVTINFSSTISGLVTENAVSAMFLRIEKFGIPAKGESVILQTNSGSSISMNIRDIIIDTNENEELELLFVLDKF